MHQTVFKTNVNIDVGKMAMEFFSNLLTCTDSDLLRPVRSFIYTANNNNLALMILDIHYKLVVFDCV